MTTKNINQHKIMKTPSSSISLLKYSNVQQVTDQKEDEKSGKFSQFKENCLKISAYPAYHKKKQSTNFERLRFHFHFHCILLMVFQSNFESK